MTELQNQPRLTAKDLELERGERLLFRGLHFDAPAGSLVRLAGANGTGKTSLLRLLTGLMQPDAGAVLYKGADISKLKEDYAKDLVYIGHMNGVKDDLSAIENVRVAARMGNIIASDEELVDALTRVGLHRSAHRRAQPRAAQTRCARSPFREQNEARVDSRRTFRGA